MYTRWATALLARTRWLQRVLIVLIALLPLLIVTVASVPALLVLPLLRSRSTDARAMVRQLSGWTRSLLVSSRER